MCPVDLSYLHEVTGSNSRLEKIIIKTAISQIKELSQILSTNPTEKSRKELADQIHKLRPTFEMLKLDTTYQLATVTEQELRDGSPKKSRTLVKNLLDHLPQIEKDLSEIKET